MGTPIANKDKLRKTGNQILRHLGNELAMVQQESSGDVYVLGHSAEEYERLRHQAQMLEPATKRIFQSIGLHAGSSCLDVGCGPGEVIRLMGEIVGPSGRVTGMDRDTRAGREAIN